jgi:hypothetical protein
MKKVKFLIVACLILALPAIGFANKSDKKVYEKIKHLKKTPGMSWIKVDRENIIIGWEGMPQVFNEINLQMAVEANIERGHKVVVWSVRHKQKGYIVGTRPFLCKTTAQKGKVRKSSCNF